MLIYVWAYTVIAISVLGCCRWRCGKWSRASDFVLDAVAGVLWPITLAAVATARAVAFLRAWAESMDDGGS